MVHESGNLQKVKNGNLSSFKAACIDFNQAIEAKNLKKWPLENVILQ